MFLFVSFLFLKTFPIFVVWFFTKICSTWGPISKKASLEQKQKKAKNKVLTTICRIFILFYISPCKIKLWIHVITLQPPLIMYPEVCRLPRVWTQAFVFLKQSTINTPPQCEWRPFFFGDHHKLDRETGSIWVKTFFFLFFFWSHQFGQKKRMICQATFKSFFGQNFGAPQIILSSYAHSPQSLALVSRGSVLDLSLEIFLCPWPWPWPRALCPRLHIWWGGTSRKWGRALN